MHRKSLRTLCCIVLILLSGVSVFLGSRSLTYAAASQPTFALPFPAGTQLTVGSLGLHAHNLSPLTDDNTHVRYQLNNYTQFDASLDLIPQPIQPPNISSIPVTSMASGTVLARQDLCNEVLIDHGNGWWAVYLHLTNIQVSAGEAVQVGSVIGYPTMEFNNSHPNICSQTSTVTHLHFAFLNGSGRTGSFVSMNGVVLCGHTVQSSGLLAGLNSTFTVPQCSSPPPPPPPPSVIGHTVVLRSNAVDSAGTIENSGYTLDGYGNITPFNGAPAVTRHDTWNWDIARGMVLCPGKDDYGYTLDGWGGIHPIGSAPSVNLSAYWQGSDIARGIVLRPDCQSGYVLDGWGALHPFASSAVSMPAVPQTSSYWSGWDIARGVVLAGAINGVDSGYVLDGWGGIHPFGNAPSVNLSAYWQGSDIARAIVLASNGVNTAQPCCSGYVLDGWGGIHTFSASGTSAPQIVAGSSTGYWPGQDIARALAYNPLTGIGYYLNGLAGQMQLNTFKATPTTEMRAVTLRSDGASGYTMDSFGNITPFNGAPTVTRHDTWNWSIARGMVLCPGKDDYGYTLDGWGGIHPIGSAPSVNLSAYWQGSDIARGIVLRPDCQSGYVLDGWGALHPFASSAVSMPAVPQTSSYWSGWDIARGVVLAGAINGVDSGYVLDGWGGIHPFGNAPSVNGNSYWQGWDIARGIVLASNGTSTAQPCCSGYVLDGYGGIHPFGGAPAINITAYWSSQDIARGVALNPLTLNTSKPAGFYVNTHGDVNSFTTP